MTSTARPLHSVSSVASGPDARIGEVFESQRATALRWRSSTAEERKSRIRALRDAVLANADALRAAAAADFRKPEAEVDLTEIFPVVAEANHALHHVERWMRPQKVRGSLLMFGTRGEVHYQPRGRCLIVSPWNYPVNLSFCPLILALAAGNTAILKPSEMTPHLSAAMRAIVEATFRADEVAVFEGDAEVAMQLLALPFDHIFFTGSPALGKQVMAAAAQHLTSVTLELGGKSPVIVDRSADLAAAAANLCWSKFVNNGQTCVAPDHVYVHSSVAAAFEDALAARIRAVYGHGPAEQQDNPDLARIVNPRHTRRVVQMLDEARSAGARVVQGGAVAESDRFVSPTVLADVPATTAVMQEEIFGPLLPLIRFEHLDDVIDQINAQPKPLALYVWGQDRARIRKLLQRTSSGGVCVNNSVVHLLHPNLPFGGVNNSGLGNTHGEFGFRSFSHARAVADTRLPLIRLFYPPYVQSVRRLIRLTLRWFA